MKRFYRYAAALCVAALLLQPTTTFAKPRDERDPKLRERIVKAIKVIQKTLRIATNDDIPTPPKP